ncbi:hypothetical protein ABH940_006457 [Streptacidiphilus sp. BW17]|uniref:hypothetical protein n=1 Tax=Streptacidiphilus sp. BW17 TaxID=3156274 RepID=UPI0035179C13
MASIACTFCTESGKRKAESGKRIRVTVTGYGDGPGTVQVGQEVPVGRVVLPLRLLQAGAVDHVGQSQALAPAVVT